jgi:hypothetical protein
MQDGCSLSWHWHSLMMCTHWEHKDRFQCPVQQMSMWPVECDQSELCKHDLLPPCYWGQRRTVTPDGWLPQPQLGVLCFSPVISVWWEHCVKKLGLDVTTGRSVWWHSSCRVIYLAAALASDWPIWSGTQKWLPVSWPSEDMALSIRILWDLVFLFQVFLPSGYICTPIRCELAFLSTATEQRSRHERIRWWKVGVISTPPAGHVYQRYCSTCPS